MNAGLLILRVASLGRDAQNERDGAGLRSSVAAATPSQLRRVAHSQYNLALNWSSSSRPSSRCCQQHLEEGRGDTSACPTRFFAQKTFVKYINIEKKVAK